MIGPMTGKRFGSEMEISGDCAKPEETNISKTPPAKIRKKFIRTPAHHIHAYRCSYSAGAMPYSRLISPCRIVWQRSPCVRFWDSAVQKRGCLSCYNRLQCQRFDILF